jgi:hypothetical protein
VKRTLKSKRVDKKVLGVSANSGVGMKAIWILLVGTLLGLSLPALADDKAGTPQQAVDVHYRYVSTDIKPLFALEDRLEEAIKSASVGFFDGDEVATDGHDGYLYMYGQNADRLFEVIKPVLVTAPFMKGARVAKRYGPPGQATRQVVIDLD